MTLKYTLKTFEKETEPKEGGGRQIVAGKTRVGFFVDDENGHQFIIDKVLTTGSKSQEDLTTEAYGLCQTEVTEWAESVKNIGKEWNPEEENFSDQS